MSYADEMIKNKHYINIRCMKCNKIISVKNEIMVRQFSQTPYLNMQLTPKYHNCPEGIQEDEIVGGNVFSISETPLLGAYEAIDSFSDNDE